MSRSRCALLAIFYAVVMTYASTIVGVVGPNFVPIEPAEALHRLIQIPYVENGSDQRSDWMGNLIMLVPLGFLLTGWLSPTREPPPSEAEPIDPPRTPSVWPAAIGAFVLCFAFIVLVKFAQLFFPPRTVTLNYVIAQSIGALIGIALFGVLRSPLMELRRGLGRLRSLRITLRIYTGLLIVFMLLPLDFALNADDITAQLDKLPDTLNDTNGEARPLVVRIAVALSAMMAVAPIGAMLTIVGRGRVYIGRSTSAVAWIGCLAMLVVYALTVLVISGSAWLPAVLFRTIGIALGAWFMHWLTRQNPQQVKNELRALVPRAAVLYVLALIAVNGLMSLDWMTPGEARQSRYDLGFLPLYNYYIVSKAQAAKNIVGHIGMYVPIGVMVWLCMADGRGRTVAFSLGLLASALVETGRFLRPGLAPDINAIPLAGISAWAAAALMPALWQMLEAVPKGRDPPVSIAAGDGAPVRGWRDQGAPSPTPRHDGSEATGDIEHY